MPPTGPGQFFALAQGIILIFPCWIVYLKIRRLTCESLPFQASASTLGRDVAMNLAKERRIAMSFAASSIMNTHLDSAQILLYMSRYIDHNRTRVVIREKHTRARSDTL